MDTMGAIDNEARSFSTSPLDLSDAFFARAYEAYRRSAASVSNETSGFWRAIAGRSSDLHDAIMAGDDVRAILSNPASNYLFYGFDNLFLDVQVQLAGDMDLQHAFSNQITSMLQQLAHAVGVGRLYNPETEPSHQHTASNPATVTACLAGVEAIVGPLSFPNPFPGEHGIDAGTGVISNRAVHAVYGAWRTKALSQHFGPRVLEIGAGLGRSAYFAHIFGITNYTIVDLPLTSLCQALFIGAALGEDMVTLSGEDGLKGELLCFPLAILPMISI